MLTDPQGRRFSYLRLSITEVCNYRCQYCLPDGYQRTAGDGPLSGDEIGHLVSALATAGLSKIRLTGGEPTTRPDFLAIAERIAGTPGVRRLAVTTNGYRLARQAERWQAAGIDAINVSIDSLDRDTFRRITGHDHLHRVLDGIAAAQAAGIGRIKVNTVLLRDINHGELDQFIAWVHRTGLTLRFIELMETGDNREYFARHHLRASHIESQLIERGWRPVPREEGAGPAIEYAHPDSSGRIGLIAPYAPDFCTSCNRLRVNARGQLRLCLFGDGGHDLRPLLQDAGQAAELQATLSRLLGSKSGGHQLHFHRTGSTRHLASLGG